MIPSLPFTALRNARFCQDDAKTVSSATAKQWTIILTATSSHSPSPPHSLCPAHTLSNDHPAVLNPPKHTIVPVPPTEMFSHSIHSEYPSEASLAAHWTPLRHFFLSLLSLSSSAQRTEATLGSNASRHSKEEVIPSASPPNQSRFGFFPTKQLQRMTANRGLRSYLHTLAWPFAACCSTSCPILAGSPGPLKLGRNAPWRPSSLAPPYGIVSSPCIATTLRGTRTSRNHVLDVVFVLRVSDTLDENGRGFLQHMWMRSQKNGVRSLWMSFAIGLL